MIKFWCFGGTLTLNLPRIKAQDQMQRGFDHKETYYVMQPCIFLMHI